MPGRTRRQRRAGQGGVSDAVCSPTTSATTLRVVGVTVLAAALCCRCPSDTVRGVSGFHHLRATPPTGSTTTRRTGMRLRPAPTRHSAAEMRPAEVEPVEDQPRTRRPISRPDREDVLPKLRAPLAAGLLAASLCFGIWSAPLPGIDVGAAAAASDVPAVGNRYWTIMGDRPFKEGDPNGRGGNRNDDDDGGYISTTSFSRQEKVAANEALIDYAVGTINTQYYDNSGGAWFNPRDFYSQWKALQRAVDTTSSSWSSSPSSYPPPGEALRLDTRDGAVRALKALVGSLNDPYSAYLTREELVRERDGNHDGFLGTGAVVEAPVGDRYHMYETAAAATAAAATTPPPASAAPSPWSSMTANEGPSFGKSRIGGGRAISGSNNNYNNNNGSNNNNNGNNNVKWLSNTRAANLPVVTAIAPNSPAERAGLVVGDRVVAVGDRDFLGRTRGEVARTLQRQYNAETYLGVADLTIARPVYAVAAAAEAADVDDDTGVGLPALRSLPALRDVVVGYRPTRVSLPTKATDPKFSLLPPPFSTSSSSFFVTTAGGRGEAVVQYELLASSSGSIFDRSHPDDDAAGSTTGEYKVGYIRLTRFSKASTAGYLQAVRALEGAGAQSYIIDLRNNYGGVIQEAMLTASTLLRDPHAVLCYTLNARGGFTPNEVGQYVVDPRYPGYLLSGEPPTATLHQMMREHPSYFQRQMSGGVKAVSWDPPSSYASIHEQVVKRGIRRISDVRESAQDDPLSRTEQQQRTNQKAVVLLINEGTASSAEFFTAALRDNGRSVAVIGTKSYGKGLIQHTFPMPDGGGLKLTVGEFLRPSLKHVTNVLDARFDSQTGEFVGGGIRPDVHCDSRQGIPGKPKADLCVGLALDVLEETAEAPPPPGGVGHPYGNGRGGGGDAGTFWNGASSQMLVRQNADS